MLTSEEYYSDEINWGIKKTSLYSKLRCDYPLMFKGENPILDKKVLNIGCYFPDDENRFGDLAKEWISIDVLQFVIDRCKAPNVKFELGDASDLRFDDNYFDSILSFSTIDHIEDKQKREKTFQESYRVLKPGGKLFISFPNKDAEKALEHINNSDYFEYWFTVKEVSGLLKNAGFKIEHFVEREPDKLRAGFVARK